ncbi:CPBP family intramembrane metalloprotease [Serratia sp. root2]|uniref:CPBP family intramembrane glutamic endopeptidase n=1 Tax=Serratia sp. root2 TaxID=3059676 RepID=UPI002890BBAA|nr:CPBP family intramembrane glutamic endopeptidase [Serratia sp. root2]MDT3251556.1 CPBP family intramembrane metalloprotease [Serratia sp. root2]
MWGVLSISLFFLPFNRLIAWLFLAASAGMGMYHGVLTPLSLGCVLVIAALAGLRHHYRAQRNLAVLLEVLVVASCVALFLHLVPGFHNQLMIDGEKPGPLSAPFTMYYNFDKALVPFLLFACVPTLFAAETGKSVGKTGWIALIVAVPALLLVAVALGGLKIELHAPGWILAFVMANLFFVCMAEEALFRGYLQQRLSQWLGAWPALIIAALVFGAAHLAGGMLMVVFATLAGLIYGLAWMWSGRLWVPILFHFGLNLTHLLLFTYPLYQHP